MNKAILIGRVTKDIELKTMPNGKSVINFTLAVNRDYKNAQGEYDADFIDCVAFEQKAETISRYVRKGDRFSVFGTINTRSYKREDGSTAKVFEIKVDGFDFLESKKKSTDVEPDEPDYEDDLYADLDGDLPI